MTTKPDQEQEPFKPGDMLRVDLRGMSLWATQHFDEFTRDESPIVELQYGSLVLVISVGKVLGGVLIEAGPHKSIQMTRRREYLVFDSTSRRYGWVRPRIEPAYGFSLVT
jgi:hypothetical protein